MKWIFSIKERYCLRINNSIPKVYTVQEKEEIWSLLIISLKTKGIKQIPKDSTPECF